MAIKGERPSGSYVQGRWTPGTPAVIQFSASVQPLRGKELEALPEGRRQAAAFKLYTDFKLLTVNNQGQKNPDVIVNPIDGLKYEVLQVFPWQNGVLSHYKAIIAISEAQ